MKVDFDITIKGFPVNRYHNVALTILISVMLIMFAAAMFTYYMDRQNGSSMQNIEKRLTTIIDELHTLEKRVDEQGKLIFVPKTTND